MSILFHTATVGSTIVGVVYSLLLLRSRSKFESLQVVFSHVITDKVRNNNRTSHKNSSVVIDFWPSLSTLASPKLALGTSFWYVTRRVVNKSLKKYFVPRQDVSWNRASYVMCIRSSTFLVLVVIISTRRVLDDEIRLGRALNKVIPIASFLGILNQILDAR